MIKIISFIAIGSAAGGVARWGVSRLMSHLIGAPTIWGTFVANVTGCFLIGLLYGWFERHGVAEHWRMFLTVGFCGGFTTFSTFVHENYAALNDGRFLMMLCYATLSFVAGLAMVYVGQVLTR